MQPEGVGRGSGFGEDFPLILDILFLCIFRAL